jgi:hypothetical protein
MNLRLAIFETILASLLVVTIPAGAATPAPPSQMTTPTAPLQSALRRHNQARSKLNATVCTPTSAARSQRTALATALKNVADESSGETFTASLVAKAHADLQKAADLAAQIRVPVSGMATSDLTALAAQAHKAGNGAGALKTVAKEIHERAAQASAVPVPPVVLTPAQSATPGVPASCSPSTAQCSADLDAACAQVQTDEALGGAAGATTPSLGAGWETAVLTGLATYLGQRAQQEVVAWLEQDFIQHLCQDSIPLGNGISVLGSNLFPATCAITDPSAPNIGTVFAAALRDDLEGLPLQLVFRVANLNPAIATDLSNRLQSIQQGSPPLEVIAGMGSKDPPSTEYTLCSTKSDPVACGLYAVGVLAGWSGDAQTTRQNLESEIDQGGVIAAFVDAVNAACTAIGTACPLRTLDATADHDAIANFLEKVQALSAIVTASVSGSGGDAAARGGQIIQAVDAIVDAGVPFLNTNAESTFKTPWAKIEPALNATAELLMGQTSDGVSDGLKALAAILQGADVPQGLVTTVSLAADLASAHTAQDVQAAIEAAAAPIGSWRTKHDHFSIDINSFVGVAGGYEAPLVGPAQGLKGGWAAAAFAPVGIDFAGPYLDQWSWGVFVSAIDVGQLLSTPIDASTSSGGKTAVADGDLHVVQVLSPGLYVHTSIGNSPIILGGGACFAPLLRYYSDANGNKSPFSMASVHAFLGVDLDLIPLYTSH